jgi:hypothetical protein
MGSSTLAGTLVRSVNGDKALLMASWRHGRVGFEESARSPNRTEWAPLRRADTAPDHTSTAQLRHHMSLDPLTAFGLCAVCAMLLCYALEDRSPWWTLAFGFSCVLGSIYGFLQGA